MSPAAPRVDAMACSDGAEGRAGSVRADDERTARAVLSRISEPADPTVRDWVTELGAVTALDRIRAGTLGGARYRDRCDTVDVEADLRNVATIGGRLLVPGDADWPAGLDDLEVPPLCLWVRGPLDLTRLRRRGVAIVGSRMCTAYGQQVAAELAGDLARRGWSIVSGAAFGIDAAAHRAALAADEPTVAVLAGGVDRPYPSAHAELLRRVVVDGAIVSESPPGSAPYRGRFITRNRLIAAMTAGTVVVEAGLRSGSLNTARHAIDVLRPVGAVPGPVTSVASAGCNEAIRTQRAVLVTDAAEVLDLVGELGVDATGPRRAPERPDDLEDPMARRVLDGVPVRRSLPVDEIARAAGVEVTDALAALARLELAGLARRDGALWRRAPQRGALAGHR